MTYDAGRQRIPGEAHEPDARIVNLWPPRGSLDRHPHGGRHLERHLVILKRRRQADDALWNQGRSFSKRMGGIDG